MWTSITSVITIRFRHMPAASMQPRGDFSNGYLNIGAINWSIQTAVTRMVCEHVHFSKRLSV
jgi:hypothetical protein